MTFFLLAGLFFFAPPPAGSYHETCRNDNFDGTTLKADCQDFFGNFQTTSLNAAQCHGSIENVDGALRCVVAQSHVGGDHATLFDILSVLQDETVNGVETKILRIDRPRVWEAPTAYTAVSVREGDKITFNAGGCVQTGGSGLTWKSYVSPDGKNAPTFYAGSAWIQGVTAGDFERIAGLMYDDWLHKEKGLKVWTVPPATNPEVQSNYFLRLSYADDNLSDNGYYSHDDGNDNQCKNIGPAWVEVTIVSNSPTQVTRGPHWSPGSKPFDVVWDMNTEDFNGLPLNPRWFGQIAQPDVTPNFKDVCGPAFSSSFHNLTIDTTKLNQICTGQAPTMDLYGTGAKCPDDPFKGHMNWTVATYVGHISYKEWSGVWWYDDDMNLMLQTASNIGFTTENLDASAVGIWIEFDASEVFDGSNGWWANLTHEAEGLVPSNKPQDTMMNSSGGLLGVVTGVFGIDGVHLGYTEMHPAFAVAVRTAEVPGSPPAGNANPTMAEGWSFFLRNSGDEGSCSSNMHFWDGLDGDYFIQLPWPAGATDVKVSQIDEVNFWSGSSDKATVALLKSAEPGWTIIKVHSPVGSTVGLDGDLTLVYSFPVGHKPQKSAPLPAVANTGPSPEAQMENFEGRISDPAVRTRFHAAIVAATPKEAEKPKTNRKVVVDPILGIQAHVAGAASRGSLTRERTAANTEKQAKDAAFEKVVESFGAEIPQPKK